MRQQFQTKGRIFHQIPFLGKFHIVQELLGKLHATAVTKKMGEYCESLLKEINKERQLARSSMKSMFSSSFGATFHTDTGQESAFAYSIHQYAGVYTSKHENFLPYPSESWLHVRFNIKIMPHHVKDLSFFTKLFFTPWCKVCCIY